MDFTAPSILLTLFTGLMAGFGSYFGAYSKVKGEVRAATEDLRQTIVNLRATTHAVELEKAQIAAQSALASDQRKAVYALAIATQSLVHSMCWLSWDSRARGLVRTDLARMYDVEVHKLMPELFGQLAVIRMLDEPLYCKAHTYVARLVQLDVAFGQAIVAAESDSAAAARTLADLHEISLQLGAEAESVFGVAVKVAAE